MKQVLSAIISLLFLSTAGFSQNIGIGTNTPHPSAKLEVSSNNSGFLPPRMTTAERNGIVNPAVGLQVYNTTTHCLEIFDFGKWNSVYCVPTDSSLVTDIDGNTYPTIKICDQTWMAKNLEVARYRNGDIIPQVTNPSDWANLATGAWCWYNNDSVTYAATYGRLYNWYAVNDPRGLAPQGWRIPTETDWNILAKFIDPTADTSCQNCYQTNTAGGALKSITLWNNPNAGASNSTGFNGQPGGLCIGTFSSIGNSGSWWSINQIDLSESWSRTLEHYQPVFYKDPNPKFYGLSVRCVKDTPITTLNNGLVAYYPFSGNAGDSSGNGNHGIVNGASLITDRYGNSEKAYSFGGSKNVSVPMTTQLFHLPNRTFSCWFNAIGGQSAGRIYETTFMNGGIALSNGNLLDTWYAYSQNCTGIVGVNAGTLNQWHHLVSIANDNSSLTEVYLDGVKVASQLGNASGNNGCFINPNWNWQGQFIRFGLGASGESFNGLIDDIRIYNRALTQAEITYLATH